MRKLAASLKIYCLKSDLSTEKQRLFFLWDIELKDKSPDPFSGRVQGIGKFYDQKTAETAVF